MSTLHQRLTDLAEKAGRDLKLLFGRTDGNLMTIEKVNLVNAINELALGSVAGGGYSVVTKTAGYTETKISGEQLALCNFAGGFTVVLPPAAANAAKLTYKKVAAAGQITISRAGADTIDGATSAVLNNQNEAITLLSDGVSNWDIT